MPLTLDQYADFLATRDLNWPAPPAVQKPKAKPYLVPMPEVRVVTWNLYGTLLNISTGGLLYEHPDRFVMDLALNKTVQEFKMWGSMSRKPGQPSEYMGQIYSKVLAEQRMAPSPGERFPEVLSEQVWEAILKRLLKKDYKFDAGFFGSLNELSRKVAYFFHASLQGTSIYEGGDVALAHVRSCGLRQGLIADGQCFSLVQLRRALMAVACAAPFDDLIAPDLRVLSYELRARKPSERIFKSFLDKLKGVAPVQVLHIGSRIESDIAPAKKLGMRTALFAGDKEPLQATADQLKDPATRPDALLTELGQVRDIVRSP